MPLPVPGQSPPWAPDLNAYILAVEANADSRASKASNLADLASASTARNNLGLGGAALLAVGTTAGTVAAGDDARLSDTRTPTDGSVTNAKVSASAGIALSKLAVDPLARANHTGTQTAATISDFNTAVASTAALKANNLSDLGSASTARTNLGLGGAATLAVGTSAGTVAAGDDSRITGAAQKASNLSDLANAGTARTNLGLGGAAVLAVGTGAGDVAAGDRPAAVQSLLTPVEWAPSTAYLSGQLVTHLGCLYKASTGFTSGGSWALTNLTFVSAEITSTPIVSGNYMFAGGTGTTGTSATLGNGTARAHAWYLPHPVTLTRIGAEVTVVGESGSKVRLGIYADTGEWAPGSLVLDAGQINGDSATVQELTISQALNPGVYWLVAVVQSAPTTQPTMRTVTPVAAPIIQGTSAPSAGQGAIGYAKTGVTGALGAFSSPTVSGAAVRIHVKAS